MSKEPIDHSHDEDPGSPPRISANLFNNVTAQNIKTGDMTTAHTLNQINNAQIENATVSSRQTTIQNANVYTSSLKLPSENIRWNVPPKSNHFVGRIELLKKIETYFNSDNNNNPLYLTTCHGLGGVGKTQLAVEFCHRNNKKYINIVWFSAPTEDELIRQYINFAESESGLRMLDREDKRSPKEKAVDVKNWLQKNDEKLTEWLLVYDNALNNEAISDLLPNCGNVLITSRYTEWSGEKIPVDVFTPEEAKEYIKKITGIENDPEIATLIEILGRLPLALAQACAYIKRNKKTIGAYIKLYKERRDALLASKLLPGGENHEPVAVTWNITLEEMEKESPESVELMYICSQFYHENIPEYLLNKFFDEEIKADNAKRIPEEYSMLKVNEDNKYFSMHILVQEIIKIQLRKDKKLEMYLRKSIAVLLSSYSENDTNKSIQQKIELLSHLQEALKNWDYCIQQSTVETDIIHLESLLANLSDIYFSLGDEQRRKELLKRALNIEEKHYGNDHYQVAMTVMHLGTAYIALGDVKRGKELLERALTIQEKYYGNEHYAIVMTFTNLGIAYFSLGDAQRSKELLERALIIAKKCYPDIHYGVALILENLGNAYGKLGDSKRSKELLEQALTIQEKYYGNEHYSIAMTLMNIGNAYNNLGDAKRSKETLERALAIQEKHYGNEHYCVGRTLMNLGIAYRNLGDVERSKELFERALIIQKKYYRKDHFEKAKTLVNLGITYCHLNEPERSKELFENALTIEKKHYGNDHYIVANSLNWLGLTFIELKNFTQAKLIFQKSLDIYDLHNHPDKKYPELNLKYLHIREGNTYLLQTEMDVKKTRAFYQRYNPSLDPEKIGTHHHFLSYFYESNQLAGCIEHYRIILKLDPNNSSTMHNLGCMIHIKAQHEKIKKSEKAYNDYLKEAETYFEKSIALNGHTGVYTEYANFMLQNAPYYAIQKIINTLNKAMQLKQIDDNLSYGIMEKITVNDNLKNLIDNHGEIQINAYLFSHYLLIQAYLQDSKIEYAKKIYASFTSEKEKIIDDFENEKKSLLLAQELQPEIADQIFKKLEIQKLKQLIIDSLFKFSKEMIQLTKNKLETLEEDSDEKLKVAIELSLQKDGNLEGSNLEKDKKPKLSISSLYPTHGMLGKKPHKERLPLTEKERLSKTLAKIIFNDMNASTIEITLNEKEGLMIKFDITIYDEKNIECIIKFLSQIEYKSCQFNCPVIQIKNHTDIANFVNSCLKGDAKLLYQEENLDFNKFAENEENCCVM